MPETAKSDKGILYEKQQFLWQHLVEK